MSDTENITIEVIAEAFVSIPGEPPIEEVPQVAEEQPVVEEPPQVEPIVEEPSQVEPIVEEPSPVEPIVEPVVVVPIEEPIVETVEEPVVEPIAEPIVEPIAEEPIAEPIVEPIVEPIAEEPVVVESIEEPVEEPIVEQPVEEPIVEPIAEQPIVEPIAEEPVVVESIAEQPIVEEPVVEPIAEEKPPKIIFIIPYRDREQQQQFFAHHMKRILEDYQPTDYKFIYAHQTDTREFNRGAMKNIGFLYAKSIYPKSYKKITFVFNDVDTMPYNKNFIHYETISSVVKHFYGYTFTLGGIVSITGEDFEKINGFPNFWAWGYEDNAMNQRVMNTLGLTIDRSQFYPIMDKNILQLKDEITRVVNRGEYDRYVLDNVLKKTFHDGISAVRDVLCNYDENTQFLDIHGFKTGTEPNPSLNKIHDMRSGPVPFRTSSTIGRRRPMMSMRF